MRRRRWRPRRRGARRLRVADLSQRAPRGKLLGLGRLRIPEGLGASCRDLCSGLFVCHRAGGPARQTEARARPVHADAAAAEGSSSSAVLIAAWALIPPFSAASAASSRRYTLGVDMYSSGSFDRRAPPNRLGGHPARADRRRLLGHFRPVCDFDLLRSDREVQERSRRGCGGSGPSATCWPRARGLRASRAVASREAHAPRPLHLPQNGPVPSADGVAIRRAVLNTKRIWRPCSSMSATG